MRLTRRGRFVAGIAAVAFVWAVIFRLASLNAVVISSGVALAAGALLCRQVDEPSVRRFAPKAGHAGDRRTVRFQLRAAGAPGATIEDALPDGVRAVRTGNRLDRVLDGHPIEYEVIAERRGVHRIGPLTVEITDPLGLVTRRFETDATAELVTYPRVYDLIGVSGLPMTHHGGASRERNEFDRVRDYERGDPLRDIHWRSTAKRPGELVVKEFIARTEANRVELVGESDQGRADAMATAAASLAMTLMNDGIEVGLRLADDDVPIEQGQPHRARLLEALARTEGGPVAHESANGGVRISADENGVQIILGSRVIPFEHLRREPGQGARLGQANPGEPAAVAADGGHQR